MEHLGRFVIVEPDPAAADAVLKECVRLRRTSVVHSAAEARAILATKARLTALITEQQLPDDPGTAVLRDYRQAYPLMPMLMLTGNTAARVINRAHSLRAEFIAKPAHRRNLTAFLRTAVAFERVPDRRVALVIGDFVRKFALSSRETDILSAAVQGTPRKVLADQIGTTENTIKSCIKGLLRKCDAPSLNEVVRAIWLEVLAGSDSRGDGSLVPDSTPPGRPFTIPTPIAGSDSKR